MTEYFLCFVLFCVGLYAVFAKRNILQIIIGIAVMGYSVNILIILAGFRPAGKIPHAAGSGINSAYTDPLAQSVVLISIIVGLAITVFLSALAIKLYERYGTFDTTEMKKMKG